MQLHGEGRPEHGGELLGFGGLYQALIRIAADAAAFRPGLVMERISFTILLDSARDQVRCCDGAGKRGSGSVTA